MRERNYSWEASAIRYRIGNDSILNTHANSISVGDKLIELEHRLVLLLIYFIHHKGEVLSKEQLLKTIWQGKVVNDDSLSVAVSHIRKALGDNPRAPQFIKTIPGVGYQFIGDAEALEETASLASTAAVPDPQPSPAKPRRLWFGRCAGHAVGYRRICVYRQAASSSGDRARQSEPRRAQTITTG